MKLIRLTALMMLAVIVIQCNSVNDLDELTSLMTGSFSSQAQAAADSDYHDIRLEMVQIWKNRTDGKWMYIEQAAADYKDKPYRQRVYHVLEKEDGTFHSGVYSLKDPLRFAGEYKNEHPLSQLTPDSLEIREGCAVILKKTGPAEYSGSTNKHDCVSTLRGASYAVSEVTVSKDGIISSDRGFDSEGKQVWGAEKGGYVFLRINGGIGPVKR